MFMVQLKEILEGWRENLDVNTDVKKWPSKKEIYDWINKLKSWKLHSQLLVIIQIEEKKKKRNLSVNHKVQL